MKLLRIVEQQLPDVKVTNREVRHWSSAQGAPPNKSEQVSVGVVLVCCVSLVLVEIDGIERM